MKSESDRIISVTIAGSAVAGRTPCQVNPAPRSKGGLVSRNWIIPLNSLRGSHPFHSNASLLHAGEARSQGNHRRYDNKKTGS
jgi:hypothetical protein